MRPRSPSLSAGCGRGKAAAAALRGNCPRSAWLGCGPGVGGAGGGTYVAFPSHLALSELDGASGSQHRGIEQLSLTKTQCGALPSALHPVVRHKWPVPSFPPARSSGCLADVSLPPQCVPRDRRALQMLPMGRRPSAAGLGRRKRRRSALTPLDAYG